LKNLKELNLLSGDIPKKIGEDFLSRDYICTADANPYIVYTTLKEYFGESHSNNIDEDKQQWQWTFSYKDFFIEIYDWKLSSTFIAIYSIHSNQESSKILAEKLNEFFVKEGKKSIGKIKTKIKNSKHRVLENPFFTYYSTAENLMIIASFINNIKANNPSTVPLRKKIMGFELWQKQSDIYRSAFLMYLSSFEGFINILYELYLKQELRDDRINEKISREQLDIKLRMLPIYCDGFKVKIINSEDERFKNYLRLISLRNNYVHANLIKSLERYVIEEDGFLFIIENEETSEIPANINKLEIKHIALVKGIIDEVIELVFESMEPKTRREFKKLIYQQEIEMIVDDGYITTF